MSKGTPCFVFLIASLVVAGCSTVGPGEQARDFELYYEDGELDSVDLEPDSGGATESFTLERERIGARFAFGGETTRGFFQVFTEDLEFEGVPVTLSGFGAGGGVKGAPTVGGEDSDVKFLIPYRADLSAVFGVEEVGTEELAVGYAELHADVGFGIEWKGLRPSAGLALSSVAGAVTYEDTDPLDPADEDFTMTGFNAGFFLDLLYKHPEFPMYAHIRLLMGNYQATTFGLGVKF